MQGHSCLRHGGRGGNAVGWRDSGKRGTKNPSGVG